MNCRYCNCILLSGGRLFTPRFVFLKVAVATFLARELQVTSKVQDDTTLQHSLKSEVAFYSTEQTIGHLG